MNNNDYEKIFGPQNFFDNGETVADGDFSGDDTYTDRGNGEDGGETITGGEYDGGLSSAESVNQTRIMGKKKEALAWLIRIDKGRIIKKIRLKEGDNLIGKSSKSEIVIDDDDEVSEEHAKIIKIGKDYKIIDLGSLNGTYLNDTKVKSPKKIEDQDEVKFANIKFIFKRIWLWEIKEVFRF